MSQLALTLPPAPIEAPPPGLRELEMVHTILDHSAVDAETKGRLLVLLRRVGFPLDGPGQERGYSRADLAALWGISTDAVSDALKGLAAVGAIALCHWYNCPLCTHHEERFFSICIGCGADVKPWCEIRITPLGAPQGTACPWSQRAKGSHGVPLLRHPDCGHIAPATAFPSYRRCPHCGALDTADHFRLCRKRSRFLRLHLVPDEWPVSADDQAELDALDQAELDATWARMQEDDPSLSAGLGMPSPACTLVPSEPPEPPTPIPGPPSERPEASPGPPSELPPKPQWPTPAPHALPRPPYKPPNPGAVHPAPAAPVTVEPSDPWQCLCGGREFKREHGALCCADCKTTRRVASQPPAPSMPEGP